MKTLVLFLLVFSATAYGQMPLSDNMPATGVLGPVDFVTKPPGAVTQSGLNGPSSIAVDPTTGKLFVSDRTNNRILRWSSAGKLINGSAAEAVFGQANFTTATANTGGRSAATMSAPVGIFVDANGALWVAEFGNHRVIKFNNASTISSGASANVVLGQADFTTATAATTQSGMNGPVAAFVDANNNLWVAVFSSHRVLKFTGASTITSGANAAIVVGQPDFTTATSGLTQSKMNSPNMAFVDAGGRLWVSDRGNSRVLKFNNAASLSNGALADGVLGQTDFTTNTTGLTQNKFSGGIRYLYGDGLGRIYVVEENPNHRIMVFVDAANLANGANAGNILGQANFTSNAAPDPPTASSYNTVRGIYVDIANRHLWVADYSNNRVLRYDVSPLTSVADNSAVPETFELKQNYPNPFNPSTRIAFSLPAQRVESSTGQAGVQGSGFTSLKVFDVLGREVATLVDEPKPAGTYTVDFDATTLSSGVYYYRLTAGSFTQTKKMILAK